MFGDFLVIPVEETFLYVQPVYVRASQQASLPELKFVLVVNGSDSEVSLGSTLDEALDAAIGADDQEPTEPAASRPSLASRRNRPSRRGRSSNRSRSSWPRRSRTSSRPTRRSATATSRPTRTRSTLAEDLVAQAEALAAGREAGRRRLSVALRLIPAGLPRSLAFSRTGPAGGSSCRPRHRRRPSGPSGGVRSSPSSSPATA